MAIAATFFAPAVTPGIARAEPQRSADDTVAGTTSHADLDLKSGEGKRVLDTRIRHLVNELCVSDNLVSSSSRKRCKEAALKAANPQVQNAVSKAEAQNSSPR
jgi:UrcA family protein